MNDNSPDIVCPPPLQPGCLPRNDMSSPPIYQSVNVKCSCRKFSGTCRQFDVTAIVRVEQAEQHGIRIPSRADRHLGSCTGSTLISARTPPGCRPSPTRGRAGPARCPVPPCEAAEPTRIQAFPHSRRLRRSEFAELSSSTPGASSLDVR